MSTASAPAVRRSWFDTGGLGRALEAAHAPAAQLEPASPDVRALRVEHGHDRVFLIMNEGTEPVDTTATFAVAGTPEIWEPDDGSHRVATRFGTNVDGDATEVPLHLEPAKVLAVVFRSDALGQPRVPHLLRSPFEATSVTEAGPRALEARLLADRTGD